MTKIVAIVGAKKTGKTTTALNLIAELSNRGYKVAVIKYVPDRYFSVDKPGTDSYHYVEQGAKTVVVASANETVTIEKPLVQPMSVERLIEKCQGNDIILVEGGNQIFAKNADVPKISIVNNREQALFALENFQPIIAFSGPFNTEKVVATIGYSDATKNVRKLADFLEEKLFKSNK